MSFHDTAQKIWHKSKVIRPVYWFLFYQYRHIAHTFPPTAMIYEHRKDVTYHKFFPSVYNARKGEPVDEKKVIFLENVQPKLTGNVELIYNRLKASGRYTIHRHCLKNTIAYRKEWKARCVAFLEDLATAKYVFVTEGSQVLSCVDLRPETIVVQTWHACGAFKRFGYSTADLLFGGDRQTQDKYPQNKNYTYVTVSSPEVSWAYIEAMRLQGHEDIVKPIGVSRTDVFFDPARIDRARKNIYEKFPAAKEKKIILYAPTFRGRTREAEAPDKLDIRAFYKALGDEYVLIIKHHQLVRKLPPVPDDLKDRFVYDGSRDMDINELLMISDICISDYSSLIFEYSLFSRPMVFFAYDLSDYFDWRGFYYNYEDMTPGPVCTTNEEMIDYIRHIDERFDKKKVEDFRYKFMRSCDGHSTDRIMKLVFGDEMR